MEYYLKEELIKLPTCCLLEEYSKASGNYWATTDLVNDNRKDPLYIEASAYQFLCRDLLDDRYNNQCDHKEDLTIEMIEEALDNW